MISFKKNTKVLYTLHERTLSLMI